MTQSESLRVASRQWVSDQDAAALTAASAHADAGDAATLSAASAASQAQLDASLAPGGSLRLAVEQFQRQQILAALERQGRNWAAAARELGLDRANLHRLAKRLGLR